MTPEALARLATIAARRAPELVIETEGHEVPETAADEPQKEAA